MSHATVAVAAAAAAAAHWVAAFLAVVQNSVTFIHRYEERARERERERERERSSRE